MIGTAPELDDIEGLLADYPRRIDEIAERGAAKAPGSDALREKSRTWTYAELAAGSEQAAERLAQAGAGAGDRVMIVGENCAALVALLFGVTRLGAWPVIVNARLSAREIDTISSHCAPRRIVYLAQVSPEAAGHARRDPAVETLSLGAFGEVLLGRLDRDCRPEAASGDAAEEVAALIYTSGTTGNPKGVMLTHRNLLYIAKLSSIMRRLGPHDRIYGVLPISHVYGLASVCLAALYTGACLQLEARYSPEAMLRALAQDGISVLQGVPSMYAKLLDRVAAGGKLDAPRLRLLYAGGSPLDPALKAQVERAFALPLHNGYGLTESSPTIAHTRLESPRTDCSVGPALPGLELRIVDRAGRSVPSGEPGELWVRGPNVMRGYYRNAELTAQTIDADGWLNTGDIARQEPDGALFIVGRTKELIIRSGFNVYPVEVETVLNAHPDVTQSAVVGRAVPGNEEVVAFVELASGATVTSADLARFAAPRLAPYKRPSEIVILPALPAASNGKILKHQLQSIAQQRPPASSPEPLPIATRE